MSKITPAEFILATSLIWAVIATAFVGYTSNKWANIVDLVALNKTVIVKTETVYIDTYSENTADCLEKEGAYSLYIKTDGTKLWERCDLDDIIDYLDHD